MTHTEPALELELQRLRSMRGAARSLAHEFKNLLGAAMGSVELLLEEQQSGDPRLLRHFDRCLAAHSRMDALVTLIQKLLRGQGELDAVDLTGLLQQVLSELHPVWDRKGIQVRLREWGHAAAGDWDAGLKEEGPSRASIQPLLVWCNGDALLGFLVALLSQVEGERLLIQVQRDRLEEAAFELPAGDYVSVAFETPLGEEPGLPTGKEGHWSITGEALRFRAEGGALITEDPRSWRLILPVAVEACGGPPSAELDCPPS